MLDKNLECPKDIPDGVRTGIAAAALAWACSKERPRVSKKTKALWSNLLDEWIKNQNLPLLVRRNSAGRGSLLTSSDGRGVIVTDNSPAHWALTLALNEESVTLDCVKDRIDRKEIPVAQTLSKIEKEKAEYKCLIGKWSLNARGWKVAHIKPVALGRVNLNNLSSPKLNEHFKRFIDPGNMFVVPKELAGFAELKILIDEIKKQDCIT